MSLKDIALQRAIGMLRGSGVVFVVADGDTVYASVDTTYLIRNKDATIQSEIPPNKQRSSPSQPRRDWKWTGYLDALKKLNAGESWSYTFENKQDAQSLQKSATSTAHALWGSANYMTAVEGSKFEILRLV